MAVYHSKRGGCLSEVPLLFKDLMDDVSTWAIVAELLETRTVVECKHLFSYLEQRMARLVKVHTFVIMLFILELLMKYLKFRTWFPDAAKR